MQWLSELIPLIREINASSVWLLHTLMLIPNTSPKL
jgi:hypothetical protein